MAFEVLALWGAAAAAAGIVVGLPVLAGRKLGERGLHVLLGLSAGLLLGVALLEVVPEAIEAGEAARGLAGLDLNAGAVGVAAGFLALLVIEGGMAVHGHARGEHEAHERGVAHGHEHLGGLRRLGILGFAALLIHGFIDGIVITSGFEVSDDVGNVVALAIVAHQVPDTAAAASLLLAAGYSRRAALAGVVATSVETPLGILAGIVILAAVAGALPFVLGFSAGTLLFISAAELIPEIHQSPYRKTVTAMVLLGFLAVFVITALTHGVIEG